MKERATTSFPVHDLIASRWSPLAFADRPLERETLASLLEAARWAPSSYNEQPWAFLVAVANEGDSFERLSACLVAGNSWAKKAPVLMLSVAKLAFERNGKPNRHALHDVGLAVENLVLQAQALDLAVHQMAGFDAERARNTFHVPPGFEPVAVLAIGYPGAAATLPPDLAARERAPRSRKPLASFVFGASWEVPFPLQPER